MLSVTPFVAFLVLKNKGALEVTYVQLTQIFAYSLTPFLPLGPLHCVLYPFSRLRLITTVGAVGISMYYIYKETREYVVKYLQGGTDDEGTLRYMKVCLLAVVGCWALLLRYYIMEP
jgi:hypothetical protein